MKREEILALEPGIELDKLVAVQVMGWEIRQEDLPDHQSYREYYYRNGEKYENVDYPDHWQPSKYNDAAWEVVEKMRTNKIYLDIRVWPDEYQVLPHRDKNNECIDRCVVRYQSLPEAICKAALLAVLEEGETT
ncbi:hypothetical protein GL282_09765 [Veillonella dispar]|nr:hypothetical protein [Veillonella dispar]